MKPTLNALRPGEFATVRGIFTDRGGGEKSICRRLLDIGLTEGARVKCLFAAPSGEPRAYRIRGAVIALRAGDAALVEAAPEPEAQP